MKSPAILMLVLLFSAAGARSTDGAIGFEKPSFATDLQLIDTSWARIGRRGVPETHMFPELRNRRIAPDEESVADRPKPTFRGESRNEHAQD